MKLVIYTYKVKLIPVVSRCALGTGHEIRGAPGALTSQEVWLFVVCLCSLRQERA